MFLEMVGLTCEKATHNMHFEEVDDILECLRLQTKLIKEKWSELKAEGKVITTPELRKKLDMLNKKRKKNMKLILNIMIVYLNIRQMMNGLFYIQNM